MNLSPDDLAADVARTIALQMLQERGRGAVLVGAARVDAALERMLQAVLLPAPGSTDPFFQPDRPLGSFGARITLAHRLGLIETPEERALHTLRRVRNRFSHSTTTATLSDPSHADRLTQAYAAARLNPLWQPLERILQEKVGADGTPLDPALRNYLSISGIIPGREQQLSADTAFAAFISLRLDGLDPSPAHGRGAPLFHRARGSHRRGHRGR